MAGVTSVAGLASNIQTDEIVEALVAADRQTLIAPLESKKTLYEGRLEAVRTLNLRLLTADSDLFYLRRTSTFNARSVTSSKEAALTATANSSAGIGTYQVKINALAQAEERLTAEVASGTTVTGTLSIQVGAGTAWSHDFSSATSLADVAKAINDDTASGVRAQVVTQGDGDQQILLTARSTGAVNTLTLGGTLADEAGDLFGSTTVVTTAQDASASVRVGSTTPVVNTITSASNLFDGTLVSGVKVTAIATTADYETLTVGNNPDEAQTRITAFVESLNAGLEYYKANASYDPATGEAGVLFSAGSLRTGIDALTRAVAGSSTSSGAYKTLAGIGITINRETGLFEVDEAKLEDALTANPEAVRQLFIEGGLADDIDAQMNALTESVTGTLANFQDSLEGTVSDLTDRIDTMTLRLDQRRTRYEAEFLAMEKLISQFNSQGNFITSQLAAFENMAASRSQG